MSKLVSNRELFMCKLVLEHYRFIKTMNNMSAEEFRHYIYGVSPASYSAFKNNDIKNVKSIISDYISIINKTLLAIRNSKRTADNTGKKRIEKTNQIIRLLYINKKEMSVSEIAKKAGLNETHFCRYHIEALKYFSEFFNRNAEKFGYKNALSNVDVRLLEIIRLDKRAKAVQNIA